MYLKLLTEGALAVDYVCQVFLFSPHFLAHSLFSTHSLQDWGLKMITWANANIVCPLAWLQREGGPRHSISPLSWAPWPIMAPKLQKPGCHHHLLYLPAITESHSWPPKHFYNPSTRLCHYAASAQGHCSLGFLQQHPFFGLLSLLPQFILH